MNVILVILDSLRKDHIGAYGNDEIQTPNLDALAKESFRFTRAYPESLPTLCARRAMHTGMRTWPFRGSTSCRARRSSRRAGSPSPRSRSRWPRSWPAAGYNTALFADTQPLFHPSMNFQRGFRVFEWVRGQERDRYRPKLGVPEDEMRQNTVAGNDANMVDKVRQYLANTRDRKGEEDYFAPRLFTRGMEYLDTAEQGQPFFLVLDSFDPHEPWDPPDELRQALQRRLHGRDPIVPNYGASDWITDAELERMKALYAGEVTMVDRWLGRFLDKMESTGRMEDTFLVVLADHGVALGEHGSTGKPYNALWPELTDIPFLIRAPEGKGAGQSSDYFASTHDVAPTILGALGLLPPQPMDGQYLTLLRWATEPEPRDHFTLGYNQYVWTRDDRYVLLGRNDRSDAKLYDMQRRPGNERRHRGGQPGHRQTDVRRVRHR